MISFSAALFAAYFFAVFCRLSSRFTIDTFAIEFLSYSLALARFPKREVECFKKGSTLLICLSSRANRDVHTPDLVDLVEVDLREDDLFSDCLLYTSDAADE